MWMIASVIAMDRLLVDGGVDRVKGVFAMDARPHALEGVDRGVHRLLRGAGLCLVQSFLQTVLALLELLLGQHAVTEELVGIHIDHRGLLPDLLVHQRLG